MVLLSDVTHIPQTGPVVDLARTTGPLQGNIRPVFSGYTKWLANLSSRGVSYVDPNRYEYKPKTPVPVVPSPRAFNTLPIETNEQILRGVLDCNGGITYGLDDIVSASRSCRSLHAASTSLLTECFLAVLPIRLPPGTTMDVRSVYYLRSLLDQRMIFLAPLEVTLNLMEGRSLGMPHTLLSTGMRLLAMHLADFGNQLKVLRVIMSGSYSENLLRPTLNTRERGLFLSELLDHASEAREPRPDPHSDPLLPDVDALPYPLLPFVNEIRFDHLRMDEARSFPAKLTPTPLHAFSSYGCHPSIDRVLQFVPGELRSVILVGARIVDDFSEETDLCSSSPFDCKVGSFAFGLATSEAGSSLESFVSVAMSGTPQLLDVWSKRISPRRNLRMGVDSEVLPRLQNLTLDVDIARDDVMHDLQNVLHHLRLTLRILDLAVKVVETTILDDFLPFGMPQLICLGLNIIEVASGQPPVLTIDRYQYHPFPTGISFPALMRHLKTKLEGGGRDLNAFPLLRYLSHNDEPARSHLVINLSFYFCSKDAARDDPKDTKLPEGMRPEMARLLVKGLREAEAAGLDLEGFQMGYWRIGRDRRLSRCPMPSSPPSSHELYMSMRAVQFWQRPEYPMFEMVAPETP